MFRTAAAAALALSLASPASAVTVLFGGVPQTVTSVTRTVDGVSLTLTAFQYNVAPTALDALSDLGAALRIRRTVPGVGVAGGGAGNQIDTRNPARREAMLLTASEAIAIEGLAVNAVSARDTLLLFGVRSDGALDLLLGPGVIRSGLGGSVSNSAAAGGTSILSFAAPLGWYDRYLFTADVATGTETQGYRLSGMEFLVVPEPQTWALMLAGFGLVGFAQRRATRRAAGPARTIA